jgi:hypothetical protein
VVRIGTSTISSDFFCLDNLSKCRKIPTRAELDQKEQSLALVRADIANKRNDLTSLKAREASQSEVGDRNLNLCVPKSSFSSFKGAQKSSWLSRVTSNFRGDDGTLVHPRVVPFLNGYQNFRTRRLSSRRSSLSKKTWHPSLGSSTNGMQSQPSTGRGRADYSFSCAMPPGSTAFSALSSYVLVYRVPYSF